MPSVQIKPHLQRWQKSSEKGLSWQEGFSNLITTLYDSGEQKSISKDHAGFHSCQLRTGTEATVGKKGWLERPYVYVFPPPTWLRLLNICVNEQGLQMFVIASQEWLEDVHLCFWERTVCTEQSFILLDWVLVVVHLGSRTPTKSTLVITILLCKSVKWNKWSAEELVLSPLWPYSFISIIDINYIIDITLYNYVFFHFLCNGAGLDF